MLELLAPFLVFGIAAIIFSLQGRSWHRWERGLLWTSMGAHLLGTFALVGITKYYYGYGDMITYHRHGILLASYLSDNFGSAFPTIVELFFQQGGENLSYAAGNPSGSMHAIAGLLVFGLGPSLMVLCATIAVLTFFAKLAIYRFLRDLIKSRFHRPVLIATMLVPSVVFWSGGLLKEGVALIFLGLAFAGFRKVLSNQRVTGGLLFGTGLLGCSLIKGYLLIPFLLGITAFVYVRRSARSRNRQLAKPARLIAMSGLAVALLIGIGTLLPRYDFRNIQDQLQSEQQAYDHQEAGSNISAVSSGKSSTVAMLIAAPFAIITALLRPAIIEARNPLALVNGLETLVLTIFLIQALLRSGFFGCIRKIRSSSLLSFCFVFTITLALGVGFSTSNLGTLSRYRMPLMPFFVVLLVVLRDKDEERAPRGKRRSARSPKNVS